MNAALLEPAAIEVERPELAAPGVIEIKPADKITNIAQLPSIWKLEQNIEWLVEGLIPLRSINLLTAESGTGKTWVAHAIAGAVADDRDFIGCKVKQKPALYLDGENPLAIVRRKLSELGIAETDNLKIWGGWNVEPPPGPDDERVVNFAKKECGLILFDSLVEFNPGDEQSSTETRAFMKKIRLLANLGATVVMLHNAGKSKTAKQYRGSSDIKAAVDTAYFVEGEPRSGRIHRMRLETTNHVLLQGKTLRWNSCPVEDSFHSASQRLSTPVGR